MTFNQIPTAFNTPAKKRIAVGAATVLTAGALLGAGVTGASAATSSPAGPDSTSASASASHNGHAFGARSIVHQVREAFFKDKIDGAKAQKLATAATEQTMVFSKLPTALQTDLTALKNASATERDAAAKKITTTSLDGGYGTELKTIATDLKSGAKLPLADIIRDAVGDLAQGKTLGTSALPTNIPSVPGAPSVPSVPSVPGVPSAPTVPSVPSLPAIPGLTAGN
jgi:hypothetical protein